MESFISLLVCPVCKKPLKKDGQILICAKKHKYKIKNKVPEMAHIDTDLNEEAKAWEDEWKNGVPKKSLKAYNKNMNIFKDLGFWEENGKAAKLIATKSDWNVLDLGCGNGLSTANLKGKIVVGLDLSAKQMERAKKKYPDKNFLVADATALPFRDNSFDLILAINVLHHLGKKTNKGLKECYRVLKKGGILLTVDPNLTNPFGYATRTLFKLLKLKKVAPTFPQFALQDDEFQFTKKSYYKIFKTSPFKNNFKITPHRIERIIFFASILIPSLSDMPFFESLAKASALLGNKIVKIPPFDWLCYFWKCEAYKT